jgi:hypothetical protein
MSLDGIKPKYSILPSEAIIERYKPWRHLEFLSLYYAHATSLLHIIHTYPACPSILVSSEQAYKNIVT